MTPTVRELFNPMRSGEDLRSWYQEDEGSG